MTTEEFCEARLAALRYFFKARLGWHWNRIVAKQLGKGNRLQSLKYHKRSLVKTTTLAKLEAVAIKHGFNTRSRLALLFRAPEGVVLHSSELDARPRRY